MAQSGTDMYCTGTADNKNNKVEGRGKYTNLVNTAGLTITLTD